MARYLIAHLNQGRCGDAQMLSGAGIDELQRGVAEYRTMGMTVGKYAMGWFASQIGQARVIWHGGNVPDFSSYLALLPEQKRGVILLINADHYGLPPVLAEVGMGVAALLAGQQPAPTKLGLIPWAMRALLLIPLLQVAGVAASLRLLRRWRMNPALRPSRRRVWGLHILPPLIPNLLLAAAPLALRASRMGRFLALFTSRRRVGRAGLRRLRRTMGRPAHLADPARPTNALAAQALRWEVRYAAGKVYGGHTTMSKSIEPYHVVDLPPARRIVMAFLDLSSWAHHTLCLIVGGIARKPAVVEGRVEPRDMLSLTLAFDHNVVDGAPAARFAQRLKELIESGYGLKPSFER